MKLPTPRWWYAEDGRSGIVRMLVLIPLSWIWAAANRIRRRTAKSFNPAITVICIGNLTLGGAGKTPVVRALLQRLRAQGHAAHGLSRGYGGSLPGPVQVDLSAHAAVEVGDEPLMLAVDAPIWVSRDRPAGAAAAMAGGAEVLVLDDGHQNPSLKKTLTLVVVDGETRAGEWPFGDGRVFPAGPLREPLNEGLARADAVVILMPADLQTPDPRLIQALRSKPILIARLIPDRAPPKGPQLGFAGIGKPWKVERALKAAGCDLVDFAPYPDHWVYQPDDLRFLSERAEVFGAGLVTTEKDWVRLSPEWREKISAWPVTAKFDDEALLDSILGKALPAP